MILSTKIMPDVIDYARKRAYLVEDLYKERANKTELLVNFLRRYPLVVWLASHGYEDAVIGPEEGQTVADLANTVWFNGKIVSIVACVPEDELIPTSEGVKRVEEVKEGDRVLTHTGLFREVAKKFVRYYDGPIVEIYPRKFGIPIRVTPEHPVLVRKYVKREGKKHGVRKLMWVPAIEVTEKDEVVYPVIYPNHKEKTKLKIRDYWKKEEGHPKNHPMEWQIRGDFAVNPIRNLKVPLEVPVTEELMELIGLYIGDGYANVNEHEGVISFAYNTNESDVIDRTKFLMKKIFNLEASVSKQKDADCTVLRFFSKPIASFFQSLGNRSETKKLPTWILNSLCNQKVAAFIKGLVNADGWIDEDGHLHLDTSSETLAWQVANLLLRLGIIPVYTHKENSKSKIGIYKLEWGGKHIKYSRFARMKPLPTSKERKPRLAIFKIRKVQIRPYRGSVYNFEVRGFHSYCGLSGTLHNCLTGRKLAPAMVESGARAVFAFIDLLTVRVDAQTYEPLPGFKECLTKPKVLYDGVKAKEAYEATIAEYNKWIEFWDKEDPTTADILRADRDAFMMFGTGESKIALSTYVFMGMTDIFILAFLVLYGILQSVKAIMPLLRRS